MSVIPFVSLWFTVLAYAQNAASHEPCGQLLPSLKHIFHSVDLTMLDLYSFEGGNTLSGLRSELFEPTCDKGTKWMIGKTPYSVPDQVAVFNGKLSSNVEALPVTCFQLHCFKEKILFALQIRLDVIETDLRGAMSNTARFKKAQHLILFDKMVFGEVYEDHRTFSATLLSTDEFQGNISFINSSNLGQHDYSAKPEPYDEFIGRHGTHFFANGLFGARHWERTTIKPEFFFFNPKGNITDNLQAHFRQEIDKLDPHFQGNTETTPLQYGQSDHPWLLKGALKRITDLFPKGPAKVQLDIAISAYMAKAALAEWKRDLVYIERVRKINWLLVGTFTPWAIISRIDSCLSETVPDQSEVNLIGSLVETMVDFVCKMHDHSMKP